MMNAAMRGPIQGCGFSTHLHAFRDGEINFATFARLTSTNWRGLALYLIRKWVPPAGVTADDVQQELLIAAWRFIDCWDPVRSPSLERFVVWNACDKAKKWLHVQRGAVRHGNADSNRGRFARPFSSFEREGDPAGTAESRLSDGTPVLPGHEAAVELERMREIATSFCNTLKQAYAVLALMHAGGAVGPAAQILYENNDARLVCRLGNEQAARRAVEAAVPILKATIASAA